ncbi:MAG TPA: hypothetical protein VF403_01675 [Kofleriaceae bacterium]
MEKPAPPNRNVVARRVAVRPRVEARTTEFDCRGIAELLDAQAAAPKPIELDLEADIEIGTSSSPTSSPRTPSRLAHTLRRDGAELARGSQPIVIAAPVEIAAPAEPVLEPVFESIVELAPPPPMPPGTMATTPMPVLMASILASDSTLVPDLAPARSRIWWIVAVAAFVMSGLALLAALRA